MWVKRDWDGGRPPPARVLIGGALTNIRGEYRAAVLLVTTAVCL